MQYPPATRTRKTLMNSRPIRLMRRGALHLWQKHVVNMPSGEHDWNGSATMTVEGADWMGTSTTSTGSSNTETEGESSSETQGNSDSIGSEVGTGGSNLTGTHTESESETSGTHSENVTNNKHLKQQRRIVGSCGQCRGLR